MNKEEFTEEKIKSLALDNAIVHNFLTAINLSHLTYQEGLIGMVWFLVEHNKVLLELLREKKESETPMMVLHTQLVNNETIEKIQKLIQDDKIVFQPAYTVNSEGKMELNHISINPVFSKCSDSMFEPPLQYDSTDEK